MNIRGRLGRITTGSRDICKVWMILSPFIKGEKISKQVYLKLKVENLSKSGVKRKKSRIVSCGVACNMINWLHDLLWMSPHGYDSRFQT